MLKPTKQSPIGETAKTICELGVLEAANPNAQCVRSAAISLNAAPPLAEGGEGIVTGDQQGRKWAPAERAHQFSHFYFCEYLFLH